MRVNPLDSTTWCPICGVEVEEEGYCVQCNHSLESYQEEDENSFKQRVMLEIDLTTLHCIELLTKDVSRTMVIEATIVRVWLARTGLIIMEDFPNTKGNNNE